MAKEEASKKIVATVDVSNFTEEDWILAQLRVEMHLLANAFVKDTEDEERIGFPPELVQFYYRLYTQRTIFPGCYRCENFEKLMELVDDATVVHDGLVKPKEAPEHDLEEFLATTEKRRVIRVLRVNAGDELSELKFTAASWRQEAQKAQNIHRPKGQGKGYKGMQHNAQHRPQQFHSGVKRPAGEWHYTHQPHAQRRYGNNPQW